MFTTFFSSLLSSPLFVERALKNTERHIKAKHYPFTAGHVFREIHTDYLMDLSFSFPEDVDKAYWIEPINPKLKRLADLAKTDQYAYELFIEPVAFFDGFFPAPIVDGIRLRENFNDPLSIKEVVSRLRRTFYLSLGQAKALLASFCGLRNGNALGQFESEFNVLCKGLVEGVMCRICLDEKLFDHLIKVGRRLLVANASYAQGSMYERYKHDELSRAIWGQIQIEAPDFFSPSSFAEEQKVFDEYFEAIKPKYIGFQFEHVLVHLGKMMSYEEDMSATAYALEGLQLLYRSTFIEGLCFSVSSLLVEANPLGARVSGQKAQYYYYKHLISGSALMCTQPQLESLEIIMNFLNNNFMPDADDPIHRFFQNLF